VFIAGIDEAGLGPVLGPFCAAGAAFETGNENLFNELSHVCGIKKKTSDQNSLHVPVADSKILYTQGTGLAVLERTVLIFAALAAGRLPEDTADFLTLLDTTDSLNKNNKNHDTLILPCAYRKGSLEETRMDLKNDAEKLGDALQNAGVSILKLVVRMTDAAGFNRLLRSSANKSIACQKIIGPLLYEIINACSERQEFQRPPSPVSGRNNNCITGTVHPMVRIAVDAQGGRKFYIPFLTEYVPEKIFNTDFERGDGSKYFSDNVEIIFRPRADSIYFETALASMTAKYVRECAMRIFNRTWQIRAPGIKPTAGYPKDGKRFIAEITARGLLPEDSDSLIRIK